MILWHGKVEREVSYEIQGDTKVVVKNVECYVLKDDKSSEKIILTFHSTTRWVELSDECFEIQGDKRICLMGILFLW